jgi:hypothetical protein
MTNQEINERIESIEIRLELLEAIMKEVVMK